MSGVSVKEAAILYGLCTWLGTHAVARGSNVDAVLLEVTQTTNEPLANILQDTHDSERHLPYGTGIRHRWKCSTSTRARQTSAQFIYYEGMKGW